MVIVGIILIILGILGRVFASVGHITDTTVKAMGWIILNKIVAVLSWPVIVVGVILFGAGLMG